MCHYMCHSSFDSVNKHKILKKSKIVVYLYSSFPKCLTFLYIISKLLTTKD
jgi:hypothetical protein